MRQEFNGPWESKRWEEGGGREIRKLETTSSSLKIRYPFSGPAIWGMQEIGPISSFPRVRRAIPGSTIRTRMIRINRGGEISRGGVKSRKNGTLTDRRPPLPLEV